MRLGFHLQLQIKVSYFSILARNRTLFTFLADRFRVVEGVGYINHTSPRFQTDFAYYMAL